VEPGINGLRPMQSESAPVIGIRTIAITPAMLIENRAVAEPMPRRCVAKLGMKMKDI
jgi:hypothetical protein